MNIQRFLYSHEANKCHFLEHSSLMLDVQLYFLLLYRFVDGR
jgi:hypothetical protein